MKKIDAPFLKTLMFSAGLVSISSCAAFMLQSSANKTVDACSYLDPVSIDILALAIAVFLVVESLAAIIKYKKDLLRDQLTRCVRLSIGSAIFVIHIMQFIHK
ncbi:MAG: hypothetical protein WC552_05355 [Candidatus Omnitrophota bacterium]